MIDALQAINSAPRYYFFAVSGVGSLVLLQGRPGTPSDTDIGLLSVADTVLSLCATGLCGFLLCFYGPSLAYAVIRTRGNPVQRRAYDITLLFLARTFTSASGMHIGRLVLLLGLAVAQSSSVFSQAQTAIHEAGRCAIRGHCGKKSFFGGELPCPDNGLAENPEKRVREKLVALCGDKWQKGPVCCEDVQVGLPAFRLSECLYGLFATMRSLHVAFVGDNSNYTC